MHDLIVVFMAFASMGLEVRARPGDVSIHGGGAINNFGSGQGYDIGGHGADNTAEHHLVGVPDISSYSGLHYPQYDLQDLGTIQHGHIPSDVVKVSNTIALKIPKPYPVKIPYNVPYPVHVPKPYSVPVAHFIKVPQPYPVEVVKTVEVPSHGHQQTQHYGGGVGDSYGGGSANGFKESLQHYGGVNNETPQEDSNYNSYSNQYQSAGYENGGNGQVEQSVEHSVGENESGSENGHENQHGAK